MKLAMDTQIWLPTQDQHFAHMKGGAASLLFYQQDRLVAAMKHVRNYSLAVDVGAHVGLLSRQLAICFDMVWAYEPNPAAFECLRENTRSLTNVVRHSAALGSTHKSVQMQMDTENSGDTYVAVNATGPDLLNYQSDRTIPQRTLDSEMSANVAPLGLLKIDVQGYEYEVLRGAEQTLRRWKPVVIVECEPGMPAQRFNIKDDAATNFLHSLGAKLGKRINADNIFYWE